MFGAAVTDVAKAHAVVSYPEESCGVVVGDTFIPMTNVADDPLESFKIADGLIAPYILNNTLQAIIHSHPVNPMVKVSTPSKADLQGCIATKVVWGIIDTDGVVAREPYWFGDFILDEDLIGAEFQHGVRDCYTAVRKWYWQVKKIKLNDMPRDDMWWESDDDLYVRNFEREGWVRISLDDITHGDVILGKVNSTKINHAAVYLNSKEDGQGVVYHHLPNRLSRREPANPWANRAELVLRYAP